MLRNPLDAFYTHMIDFQIYRNSQLINTSKGLKTLASNDSEYRPYYYGDVFFDYTIGI